MAKMVLLASFISIDANDLSNDCSKIELTAEIAEKDVTTYGSDGWNESLGGLGSGSLALTFKQDVDQGALDDLMWPLFIGRDPVPFEVRIDQATVGSSNPSYTGNVLMTEWKPVTGNVGDVAEVDVSFPTSGPVSRNTS